MVECVFGDIIHNITNNCENDIEVIKDSCKVICLTTIIKALDMCYFQMLETGLINQMKDIIKFCYYKKFEGH